MFCVKLKPKSNKIIRTFTKLIHFSNTGFNLNDHIQNVKFLNVLITSDTAIQKVFARKVRCAKCAGDHSTINYSCREKSEKNVKCVLCKGNHLVNYKGCIVYKDLQRNFFSTL